MSAYSYALEVRKVSDAPATKVMGRRFFCSLRCHGGGFGGGEDGVFGVVDKNFFHPCKSFAIGLMNATLGHVFRSFSWKDLVGIGYLIYLCNRKRGNDLLQRMSHPSEGG